MRLKLSSYRCNYCIERVLFLRTSLGFNLEFGSKLITQFECLNSCDKNKRPVFDLMSTLARVKTSSKRSEHQMLLTRVNN